MRKIEEFNDSKVLNLGSLHEEVIKEKENRKIRKTPIILIILAILLILSGVFYKNILSFLKLNISKTKKTVVVVKKNTLDTLTCTTSSTDPTIGINEKKITIYTFKDSQLKKEKITTTYDVIENYSDIGTNNLKLYYQKYTTLATSLNGISGLDIKNTLKNNVLTNIVTYDLNLVDATKISQNDLIVLTNTLNQTRSSITELEGKAGHICT